MYTYVCVQCICGMHVYVCMCIYVQVLASIFVYVYVHIYLSSACSEQTTPRLLIICLCLLSALTLANVLAQK